MEGSAYYADDPNIADDAILWRRVLPKWVVLDENSGRYRPSSAVFQDSSDSPMSILIEGIVKATNRTAADVLREYDGFSLCSFTAGLARELGQVVATLPEEPNEPAHGYVVGKKTESIKKRFIRQATWVILKPSPP
jgi:hypothetical protein